MRRDGSKYFRWQADRCRELAERQPNADVKAHLFGVASQYDRLAKDAEVKPTGAELRDELDPLSTH